MKVSGTDRNVKVKMLVVCEVIILSRICAVAQYVVLVANGKVNGRTPTPLKTLGPL